MAIKTRTFTPDEETKVAGLVDEKISALMASESPKAKPADLAPWFSIRAKLERATSAGNSGKAGRRNTADKAGAGKSESKHPNAGWTPDNAPESTEQPQ